MNTPQYAELYEKYQILQKEMTPMEITCIALTTPNIHSIDSSKLDFAIPKVKDKIHPFILENLEIMNRYIKLKEMKGDNQQKNYFINKINQQWWEKDYKRNYKYINLQGTDLTGTYWCIKGANFKNAVFNPWISANSWKRQVLASDAMLSERAMISTLDQLENQLKTIIIVENKKITKEWFIKKVYNGCANDFLNAVKYGTYLRERPSLCLSLLNIFLAHPIAKRPILESVYQFFGTWTPLGELEEEKTKLEIQLSRSSLKLS